MPKANFSKVQFLEFLNYLKNENIQPNSTLAEWRSAAAGLLDDLTLLEEKDLRRVDVDSLVDRLAKKSLQEQQSITPGVLHQYRKQLGLAIGDFIAYAINPMRYRAERARITSRLAGRHVGRVGRKLAAASAK